MRVLLALLLACSACKSTAEASRQAWQKAVEQGGGDPTGASAGGSGRGTTRGGGTGDGGQALAQFVSDAVELLAGGSTTASLLTLAERLCLEPPPALAEDPDLDAVRCEPKTKLVVLSHELQLELGRPSTIGASIGDLSDQDSADLVRDALKWLRALCREPWTPAPRGADNALEEFHTCPTDTGAELAVGRFPHDLGAGQWQFSLAVLGPG